MVDYLPGWANRLRFKIPAAKVTANLTWFPVCFQLSNSVGIGADDLTFVFDHLGANSLKIAFTSDDGVTELYAEVVSWDNVAETAEIHVSKTGWTLSNGVDNYFYFYYDVLHADNTSYVGVVGSAQGEAVWDANFKLVTHMNDNPDTSHVMDSTSNDNDGTKKAANEPIETVGKIGKGQDFELSNSDYIRVFADVFSTASDWSFSAWITLESNGANMHITRDGGHHYIRVATDDLRCFIWGATHAISESNNANFGLGTPYFVSVRYDSATKTISLYKNGVELTYGTQDVGVAESDGGTILYVGTDELGNLGFDGVIDEIQYSQHKRSVAWVGASYETQRDEFFTYDGFDDCADSTIPYYKKYFWKHLPKMDRIPPKPDPSKIDWSYKALEKSKLERKIKEVLK